MTAFPYTEVACDGAGYPDAPRCDKTFSDAGRPAHVRATARDLGWQTLPAGVDRCPACVKAARDHARRTS